jgi:hypothetical protein
MGRHLVDHRKKDRILIPSVDNYQTVLNISGLLKAEQLIFHLIYKNTTAVEEICRSLGNSESFMENSYSTVEEIFSQTQNILALTDPTAYCSRVSRDEQRFFNTNILVAPVPDQAKIDTATTAFRDAQTAYDAAVAANINDPTANPQSTVDTAATVLNTARRDYYVAATGLPDVNANIVFNKLPGFLQNLVRKAVAPEILQIDLEDIRLNNAATCQITAGGLIASVPSGAELYNPVQSDEIAKNKPNRLQVRNVLKFEGDTRQLDRSLANYEEHQPGVKLFLGYQLISSENNILRVNNFLPAAPMLI